MPYISEANREIHYEKKSFLNTCSYVYIISLLWVEYKNSANIDCLYMRTFFTPLRIDYVFIAY